jgi:hypothetical protein
VSGAIDGMARVICAGAGADFDRMHPDSIAAGLAQDTARAAWAYALATLREPSEAMIHAAYDAGAWPREVLPAWDSMLDAFAAEHGIELPQEPASPEPQG